MIRDAEMNGEPAPPKGVTPEQAANNPQVKAIVAPRIEKLTEVANGFLDTILNSLDAVPYGIRWICKQIRSLTKVLALKVSC